MRHVNTLPLFLRMDGVADVGLQACKRKSIWSERECEQALRNVLRRDLAHSWVVVEDSYQSCIATLEYSQKLASQPNFEQASTSQRDLASILS